MTTCRHILPLAFASLILLAGCFREINLEDVAFEDLLVVDARITDEVFNQEIYLSRTVPVSVDSIRPEEGASVQVVVNDMERIDFNEISPGTYRATRPFGAEFNSVYRLEITTNQGRSYVSSRELMIDTPAIDRVFGEFERFQVSLFEGDGTFNFLYDAGLEANGQQLYLIEWSETYLVKVPFPSNFIWRGGNVIDQRGSGEEVEICFLTRDSPNVTTHQSLVPSGAIKSFPLRTFESVTMNPMAIRYSLEVRQFALGNEAYTYWEQIDRLGENENLLIQEQPGTINGNIQNEDNEDEIVLGRFDVFDQEGLRVFFSPQDFEEAGYQVRTDNIVECDTIGALRSEQEFVGEILTQNPHLDVWFIDNGIDFESQEAIPILVYLPKSCSNCTFYGTTERPTFWTD